MKHPAQQPAPNVTPHDIAKAALSPLGDQWGAESDPSATSGHLHGWDGTPFTIAIRPTGEVTIRNDETGDTGQLPVTTADGLEALGRAVAEIIGHLY
ncbi:hypothetical protein [Streptomyces sp. AGS-58]|uniref:hypothetical protein n=1 Tax=unclassified Streptomyces TaxID=2593676 RepID=UPI0035A331E5